jgi:hypothetical protein
MRVNDLSDPDILASGNRRSRPRTISDIANASSRALCRLSMIFPHCGWGIGLISAIRFVQGRIKNKSNKVAKVSKLNQIHRTVI